MTIDNEHQENSSNGRKMGFWSRIRYYLTHMPGGFLRSFFSIILIIATVLFLMTIYWKGFGLEFFATRFAPTSRFSSNAQIINEISQAFKSAGQEAPGWEDLTFEKRNQIIANLDRAGIRTVDVSLLSAEKRYELTAESMETLISILDLEADPSEEQKNEIVTELNQQGIILVNTSSLSLSERDLVQQAITNIGLNIPEIQLTVMLISGVIVLVISLGLLIIAFHTFNPELITLKHSLGLPEGSVRSLVALMLVMLFSILSVHLYWKMSQTRPVKYEEVVYTGLPREQMESLRLATPPQSWLSSSCSTKKVSEETYEACNVVLLEKHEERNEESERFAQQVLTTISTLVIALAGFYFGSRAVTLAGDLSHQSAQRADAGRKRKQNSPL